MNFTARAQSREAVARYVESCGAGRTMSFTTRAQSRGAVARRREPRRGAGINKSHVTCHMSHVFLAAGSSLLLILSFPPFNVEFLAWVALVPLLFAIEDKGPAGAFLISYCAGLVFFFGTIWWLVHVTLPGMVIVVLYLALYFGFFGALSSYGLSRLSAGGIPPGPQDGRRDWLLLYIPSAWVAVEYLRAHLLTGFGWVLLGYSQYLTLPVIQMSDITGVWGVSFLIALVNVSIYQSIRSLAKSPRLGRGRYTGLIASGLFLFAALYYGNLRLRNIFTGDPLRVSVVQGNIPQHQKWDPRLKDTIMGTYERLTRAAAREAPDLIVWPETSVPDFIGDEECARRVTGLAQEVGIPLLAGAMREEGRSYYNSALFVSAQGEIASWYDKLHLVPFGEYVPFRTIFSFVDKFTQVPIGDFTKGEDYTVFAFDITRSSRDSAMIRTKRTKVKFSALICFEDIFPEIARGFIRNGAYFLCTITNDAWYLKTAAPYQHAQASVFRAVELRTNMVRAANTGLSCFIDQKGRIVDRVGLRGADTFVEGFKTHEIILSRARTFYMVFGDLFAYVAMALTVALFFVGIFLEKSPGRRYNLNA